jgi:hypothetical protein
VRILARIVSLITTVVVGLIVIGILLVVLKANPHNDIVRHILDWARWLVGPFKDIFKPHNPRVRVAVNWGLAAIVYGLIGSLIVRLLQRGGARVGGGGGRGLRRRRR